MHAADDLEDLEKCHNFARTIGRILAELLLSDSPFVLLSPPSNGYSPLNSTILELPAHDKALELYTYYPDHIGNPCLTPYWTLKGDPGTPIFGESTPPPPASASPPLPMMFQRIKRSLGGGSHPRPVAAEYQAITEDDMEDSSSRLPRTRPGTDVWGQVYWAFWALGAGVLLSWNVLICSFPLLASFFVEGSSHHTNLASYLSTVYCFSNLFFLGISQRTVSTTSPDSRIRWSLSLLILTSLIFSVPIIPYIIPSLSSSPNLLLSLLIITSVILALSTAYLQSGVFALSALWPTSSTSSANATLAVMSGQGGIAVLVSATQLVLAAVGTVHGSSADDDQPSARTGIVLWVLAGAGGLGCQAALRYLCARAEFKEVGNQVGQRREEGVKGEGDKGLTKSILKKNARLELAVAWVFTVTLSVFPPLTTAIVSTHQPTPKLLQAPVFIPFHFLIFNIGDYLGRTYLPRRYLPTSQNTVLSLSLARTLLIPLFLLCNVNASGHATPTSTPWINSDIAYFTILLTFGLTNGWISSLCMILASNPVLNSRIQAGEQDVAGTLAAFCLVSGLAAGSVASFGVNWIIRGKFV